MRRRGECWSVAALVAEENVNALATLMRGGGGRLAKRLLLLFVVVQERTWSSDDAAN